jgi:hypothetical protein
MKRPAMTHASLRLNVEDKPSSARPVVYESKRTSAASAAEPIA